MRICVHRAISRNGWLAHGGGADGDDDDDDGGGGGCGFRILSTGCLMLEGNARSVASGLNVLMTSLLSFLWPRSVAMTSSCTRTGYVGRVRL